MQILANDGHGGCVAAVKRPRCQAQNVIWPKSSTRVWPLAASPLRAVG